MTFASCIRATRNLLLATISCWTIAAVFVAILGMSDHVAFADAVVVPGNTVFPDGTISSRLKGRLDAAVSIFRSGGCKVILVSGATGTEGVNEAKAMAAYLVTQGVSAERIIQDPEGFTTADTARNAATALKQRGYVTVLAVSQFFHVPRLSGLLGASGLVVVGSKHASYFELRDLYSVFREVPALCVFLVSAKRVA